MDYLYNKTSLILNMELVSDNSISLGNITAKTLKLGNVNIAKVYLGNKIIFPLSNMGLIGTRYIGYHGDDPAWFDTATPFSAPIKTSAIDNFSSSPDQQSEDYYSWQWVGYFKASSSEDYTFYTSSDDGSYLWIGDNAINNYTIQNALVNNGGAHGLAEVRNTISLIANRYYPIRIQYGEIGGGDVMTVNFSTPNISKTTNGNGYYYNQIIY